MSKVSIIVPLHNKGRYIQETIQSVIDQTMENWELIIVENGSTDDGPAIVGACSDLRIRLIDAPPNVRGPGAARNLGLDHANGEWVLFLDADDLLGSTHLEVLISAVAENSAEIAVTGWQEFKDGSPDRMESKEPMGRGKENFCLADHSIAFAPWAVHCALIKRERLDKDLRWQEELDKFVSEDTAFWFRLVSRFEVVYSEQNTAIYRTHTEQFRNQFDDVEKWFAAMKAVTNSNLEFANRGGGNVNAKQAENLMRLWADVARRSSCAGNTTIANVAFTRAQTWLEKCRDQGGIDTWPLRIRSLLSVKRFHRWKNAIAGSR